MVKRFRTRIVEIEAMQWQEENFFEMADWTEENFTTRVEPATGITDPEFTGAVFDKLHQTWIGVKTGQWIVRGVKGEYYPCDDETFHWKYEELVEDK